MATITINRSYNIDDIKANQFVAVHNALATAQSSPDGKTWTSRTMPGAATNWLDVAYGDPGYDAHCVAVSSGTRSATTADGYTWYSGVLPTLDSWNAIAYGSGRFVTIAGNTLRSAYSIDGVNWTSGNLGVVANWKTLKFFNNQFTAIAYNSDKFIRSYDGLTWVSGLMPAVANWSDVTYDPSLNHYVAIAIGTNVIAHSNDGITWSGGTIHTSDNWRDITCNNSGLYVAVADNYVAGYSQGGFSWSSGTMPISAVQWTTVNYGLEDNIFVAHSNTLTSGAYSYDGAIWFPMTKITGATNSCCYAPFSWRSGDQFTITNQADLLVNTDQKKFPYRIDVGNGTLSVKNTSVSTSGAFRFITGRTSGATLQYLIPTNGLGSILISGNLINIGTGSGIPNQIINTPYSDFITCIWVERGFGSGVYDIWNNALENYGKSMLWTFETNGGMDGVGTGRRGLFFTQDVNPIQDRIVILPNCSGVWGCRLLTVSSTSGVLTGAQLIGSTAVPANTIVERIVSNTVLEMSQACTTSSNAITATIYNPFKDQLLNTIHCGDGQHGNVFPSGANILIPNIMCTSDAPANLQTNSAALSMQLYGLNGGSFKLHNCLFDEAYHDFTQSQTLDIKNVGCAVFPLFAEIYNLSIDGFATVCPPCRRIYGVNSQWQSRNIGHYSLAGLAFSYISDAILNNIVASYHNVNWITGSAGNQAIRISNSNNVTASNLRVYQLSPTRSARVIAYLTYVNDSTFTNLEGYGTGGIWALTCANNVYSGILVSEDIFNCCHQYTAASRINYDPVTGLDMIEGQKYYFKTRTYFTKDYSVYTESRTYSATPFLGAKLFPDYFGCNCNGSQSVVMSWTNRSPVYLYEIYRDTNPGFVTRDYTTKVMGNPTVATVTWTNGPRTPVTASPASRLVFTAAGKTIGTSGTSFLTLGYSVGDVIDVSGTGLNNGSYTVTAATAALLTVNNTYDTIATENATSGVLQGRVPNNGTTYYYVFRKYDSVGVYNESAEMEVTPTQPTSITNLALQNNAFENAAWTIYSGVVTAGYDYPPTQASFTAIATVPGDKFQTTKPNGYLSQAFTTVSGQPYTFAVWCQSYPTAVQFLVSGFIGLSGSATNYPKTNIVCSGGWMRPSVTIIASGTSTTAFININTSGDFVCLASATINSGVVPIVPLPTYAVTTQNANEVQDISVLTTWCRSYADETQFNGIAFTLGAAPSGAHTTEIFCGTSGSFTPSIFNRIMDTNVAGNYAVGLTQTGSKNHKFYNIQQVGRAACYYPLYYTDASSSDSLVKDLVYDLGTYQTLAGSFVSLNTQASNCLFANWELKNPRNYMAINPVVNTNINKNITFQNIRCNKSDIPINFQSLNTIVKGMTGANATPANAATSYVFGSTTDGIAISYTAVYDTIFNELYFTETSGCLHLLFNASAADNPPYVISGYPYFSNTGRLYIENPGDSVTYTWPHKILGVSGFSAIREPLRNGSDFGITNTVLEGLKIEYNLNTGSGYHGYKELTLSNIGSENVSPVSGFYLQLKLTGMAGLKYGGVSEPFIVGERIKGTRSLATATVDRVILTPTFPTSGNIWLSDISGTFQLTDALVQATSGTAKASSIVATNTNFPLFPSYNSYIDGLQIYTKIDRSVLYPTIEENTSLVLTGLQPGSEVRIYKTSNNDYVGGVASSSGSYTYNYVWDDITGDINVYIRIIALDYQWLTFEDEILGRNGLIIPVQQQRDRQYLNP